MSTEDHPAAVPARDTPMSPGVQMIDTRAWEEDGEIVARGPDEPAEGWLEFAAGYAVEIVVADVESTAENGGNHRDVVALFPDDPRLPALYFLVTAETAAALENRQV